MYNAAIIGTGQLGSRHLQGLKTASLPFKIWVMDKSEDSLNIAKQRYDSVAAIGEKEIELVTDIEQLPTQLDFVVIATGSKPRASIVKSLIDYSDVKYMILEKVLFPRLSDYDEIGNLINKRGVKCWVNCGRRLLSYPYDIKKSLSGSQISMKYKGANWGLCCNSIHIIDLFMFLTDEKEFTIDTSGLYREVYESKRNGYIELFGEIIITTKKGSKLYIKCDYSESIVPPIIEIEDGSRNIKVDESKHELLIDDVKSTYQMPYQSEMTGLYADLIVKTGNCALSTLELSSQYHKVFIQSILDFYNSVNENKTDLCPIT